MHFKVYLEKQQQTALLEFKRLYSTWNIIMPNDDWCSIDDKIFVTIIHLTCHYCDAIMGAMASQIPSLTIVYSTVYSWADQRKHESSASLAFVRGIHRWPVNSPHKAPVTRKTIPFDDVIIVSAGMWCRLCKDLSECRGIHYQNNLAIPSS